MTSIVNTVYETQEKEIYDKEEKQLFNISHDLKMLLESMEHKKDEV